MKHNYSFDVKAACKILGFSRQAYYRRRADVHRVTDSLIQLAGKELTKSRGQCPSIGCRAMYEDFGHLLPIGRDKSIRLFMNLGYRVRYPKRYGKATQAGSREFPNLLTNREITGLNQVWQSDMAHYLYGNIKLYTIYITDVYSQEIIGHGAYSINTASSYTAVLHKAIKKALKRTKDLSGLIHHSDGGKQYESTLYKSLCSRHQIKQSMCMYSYENPYAEKTNDLINNGYLNIWKPKTLNDLIACQDKAVQDHNERRKKKVLGKLTPNQFIQTILKGPNSIHTHTLTLKPSQPEQPKKRIPNKSLILTRQ